jgi:hypothetical protein
LILKKDILVCSNERLMVLLFENGFSAWGQFLQSFCRSTSAFVISRVANPCRKTTFTRGLRIAKHSQAKTEMNAWDGRL